MSTLTLRPSGAGDYTNIDLRVGDTENYLCVDEAVQDGNTTYIRDSGTVMEYDAYALPNHTTETGTINFVKVYFCVYQTSDRYYQPGLRLAGAETLGTLINNNTSSYVTNSETLARPGGGAWSWADIDALQVVIGGKETGSNYWQVTQVYVEVDYTETPAGWTNISKVCGVTATDLAKVNGIAVADISKINGVAVFQLLRWIKKIVGQSMEFNLNNELWLPTKLRLDQ